MISITDKGKKKKKRFKDEQAIGLNCVSAVFSLEQEKLLVSLCPLEDKQTHTCSVKSELFPLSLCR